MSDLGALTQLAGKTIFSAASPWRETVGYRTPTVARREISAVVSRDLTDGDPYLPDVPVHSMIVHIANDATIGVDEPKGGDFVDFLDVEEGNRWEFEVVGVLTADSGRWQLRVEKRARYTP